MKRQRVTKVEADGRNGGRVGLACEFGGARYHIWLDPVTKDAGDAVYKNPQLAVDRHSPGHFRTRRLSVSSKFSTGLIAEMLRVCEESGLLAKLEEREAREREGLERKADAADRARQIRDLAPEMARLVDGMRCQYKAPEAAGESCGHCTVCRVRGLVAEEARA